MQPPPCLDEEAFAKLLRIGGPQFARNMVDLFLDYAPTKLAAAQTAERTGDWQGVVDAMHPLRTCAGHVGAAAVRALAVEIEGLAPLGDAQAPAAHAFDRDHGLGGAAGGRLDVRADRSREAGRRRSDP